MQSLRSMISRNIRAVRISGALVAAVFFVGIAYVSSGPSFLSRRYADASSTEELLKAYASKDSDADSLPDWQEAVYGTDPNKADTDGDGLSDGDALKAGKLTPQTLKSQIPQADTTNGQIQDLPGTDPAPGSMTEQFSRQFLQAYMEASGGQPLAPADQETLVTKLMQGFGAHASNILDSRYELVSVRTSTMVTVPAYALAVESIVRAHDVPAEDSQPLPLMESLIGRDDETARPKLVAISNAYAAITKDLAAASVPPSLASQHLSLLQAFDSLARATRIASDYEKDPLATLGALAVFKNASLGLSDAFTNIATVILASGEPEAGMPGALIVQLGRIGKQ